MAARKARAKADSLREWKTRKATAKAEADSLVCFDSRRKDGLRFGGEAAIP
jgi:hypothetical protein